MPSDEGAAIGDDTIVTEVRAVREEIFARARVDIPRSARPRYLVAVGDPAHRIDRARNCWRSPGRGGSVFSTLRSSHLLSHAR